jgi:hypothetical protein
MIKNIFIFTSVILIIIIFIYHILYKILFKKLLKSHDKIDINILNLNNNIYNQTNLSDNKLVILLSHYNENLFWLKNIKYPFIISSKTEKNKTRYLSINKGNEAYTYLDYIVKYYDVLPEYTLFCHGHYIDWHQRSCIDTIINTIELDKKYVNINDIGIDDRYCNCDNKYYKKLVLLWDELFLDTLGPIAEKYYDKCCAQFIVHKDRIRLRPKKFYERLIEYIINKDQGEIGYILEYIWHNIFGENPIMKYEKKILDIYRLQLY